MKHVVQAFVHLEENDYEHLFVFDDLWGAANPTLADALIRYTRWDMLSTGKERRIGE